MATSKQIQKRIKTSLEELEAQKVLLKQFEDEESNASDSDTAIVINDKKSRAQVVIDFNKKNIRKLRSELEDAIKLEDEQELEKRLLDAQKRVNKELAKVKKLDNKNLKLLNEVAKYLEKRKAIYKTIKDDAEFLNENNVEIKSVEHLAREEYITNVVTHVDGGTTPIDYIKFKLPIHDVAVVPHPKDLAPIYVPEDKSPYDNHCKTTAKSSYNSSAPIMHADVLTCSIASWK